MSEELRIRSVTKIQTMEICTRAHLFSSPLRRDVAFFLTRLTLFQGTEELEFGAFGVSYSFRGDKVHVYLLKSSIVFKLTFDEDLCNCTIHEHVP